MLKYKIPQIVTLTRICIIHKRIYKKSSALVRCSTGSVADSSNANVRLSFGISKSFGQINSFLTILKPVLIPMRSVPRVVIGIRRGIIPKG